MTQDDGGYEIKPLEQPAAPSGEGAAEGGAGAEAGEAGGGAGAGGAAPKPGEPGWAPPEPVVEKAEGGAAGADEDVEKNKGMAVLAYICFIVPLVAAPKSDFARFHANQGLLSFICWCVAVAGNVALYVFDAYVMSHLEKMTVLHGFFSCGILVLQAALLVSALALMLHGIVKAANGERKALPVVGQITLIK